MKKKNMKTKGIMLILTIIFLSTSSILPLSQATEIKNTYQITQNIVTRWESPQNDGFSHQISVLMKLAHFPSLSMGIINDDKLTWSQGYGYYDLENQKQPNEHTIYCIASITKIIVGTALMQLYEQEYFELDDDVNTVLPFELRNPNFPNDPITFRMLLSHTSSLNMNTRNVYYWMNYTKDPPYKFFPEPYLEEFLLPGGKYYHDTVWSDTYRPGEQAIYANVGFDLISYLVELISNEPFLEYCQHHIFDPLEMNNTSFNLSMLSLEQVAIPYHYYLGTYYQINQLPNIFGPGPETKYWKMRAYPAGGLYTSVSDLSHFLITHMNDGIYKNTRILEKNTVDLMHTIDSENQLRYGLAWMQYSITSSYQTTGHGGDIMGVDTWMLYHQDDDRGIIYLANGNPYYGFMPRIGGIAVQYLLYLLFTKNI